MSNEDKLDDLLQECFGPKEGQKVDLPVDHPLSETGMKPEEFAGYYYTYAVNCAKDVDQMVKDAGFAEVSPYGVAAAFINELIRLNPEGWAMFAKNDSKTH